MVFSPFYAASRVRRPQAAARRSGSRSLLVLAIACAYPQFSDGYTVGNTAYFFVWVFIALSLCLIWGYGGSLSFGQTAFFGIAGYGYGILALNFGSAYGFTLIALLLAVALAALFALLLGYFMFFGRIAGVFLGIVTLAVTLMLERFMAQTAGSGVACRRGAPERLQRHERDAAADDPVARRRHRAVRRRRSLLPRAWAAGRGLSRPAHPDELARSAMSSSRSGKIRSARRCWATTSANISSSPL